MAKLLFTFLLAAATVCTQAQNVGIGTTSPAAGAALEISSNNKGLLIPRTSASSRMSISSPPKGLMVYDTTYSVHYYYDGGRWLPFYQQNYDSATIDYSSAAVATVNLSTTSGAGSTISSSLNSGFIYDNGGPAGNYLANSNSNMVILKDDSTLLIKINVEEMAAEVLSDSLFLIYGANLSDGNTLDTIGISGTQTGNYSFNSNVKVLFKSNNINQLAGFKIRWARVKASTTMQQPVPLYGWHFNIQKQAAMGGVQQDNNWHKDSVGFYSLSYGNGAKAKGNASFATGYGTTASGNYSTAMGNNTNATGYNSTAIGNDLTASGNYSTAMGNNTNATGYNSAAMGDNTTASGSNSTAMGVSSIASGQTSTAMGSSTIASGLSSTAMGASTIASGLSSTAMGDNTIASGGYSTAMGFSTTASGYISTAMGYNTTATGVSSTAMGYNADATGSNSTAMGTGTVARAYSSLSIGRYNDSIVISSPTTWVNTDPLFIIGNGTASNARSNAMVVLKNGNVAIGDNNTPVNRLHITGGTDLDLTDNTGFITLGGVGGGNMVFDNNELQVRNNGAASNLYLQNKGGNVGIGNTGTPGYQLEITGTAGKPGGGSWSNSSDMRLKQNVEPYKDGLSSLLKIKPVWYNYNQLSGYDVTKKYVGVLAQDLQQVSPYMVAESSVKKAPDGSSYLQVDNSAMTYMLINAVKEQQQIIEALKKRIEVLEGRK